MRAIDVPAWLNTMRAITGMTETPGDADNPRVTGMADAIARRYNEMQSYCDQYQHDETPWCGLTAAFCMSMNNIRPVFGETDTDKFLWAQAWLDWGLPIEPAQGCVMIFERDGGGHVTFLEEINSDGSFDCRGGNQGDCVKVSTYSTSGFLGARWPMGEMPPGPVTFPTLEHGDTGPAVTAAQKLLNGAGADPSVEVDGDFGPATENATMQFQSTHGLPPNGVIGSETWRALLKANAGGETKMKDMVVDLSHWNTVDSYAEIARAGIVGVIYKGTESTNYFDPTYEDAKREATAAGLLWGSYHFLRPGNMREQAEWFISKVGDELDLYAADHEDDGVSLADLKQFLSRIYDLTGQRAVIYSGNVLKGQLGDDYDEQLSEHRLWLAHYTEGEPSWPKATFPEWWIWQHTDKGSLPGVSGGIDLNYYDGTPGELAEEWSGVTPEPGPEPVIVSINIDVEAPPGVTVNVTVDGSAAMVARDD